MLPHILCQHLIMCQQQDRMPHIMHLDEDISDTTSLLRIEIAARFIDEQKLWSMDESSGQTDELFLSFREVRDQDIRLMDESHLFDDIVDGLMFDSQWHLEQTEWERDIFSDSFPSDQLVILEDGTYFASELLHLTRRKSAHILLSMVEHLLGDAILSHQDLR